MVQLQIEIVCIASSYSLCVFYYVALSFSPLLPLFSVTNFGKHLYWQQLHHIIWENKDLNFFFFKNKFKQFESVHILSHIHNSICFLCFLPEMQYLKNTCLYMYTFTHVYTYIYAHTYKYVFLLLLFFLKFLSLISWKLQYA